ncbi:MAG: NERD domain-containing protein [Thermoplasmatales archaeon]|nr:NERD domain-containing protein [Thermoplasmatales archaeon]
MNSNIKLYVGKSFENRHEIEEFNKILAIIKENIDSLGDFVVIFASLFLEGEEIDLIFFNQSAIIIIEMKSWSGVIKGKENGDWEVNGKKEKNAFQQCIRKRYALFEHLNKTYQSIVKIRFDVCAWVVCDYGADCSGVECSEKNKKWFRTISLDDLGKELIIQRSPHVIRGGIDEIEKIAKKLALKEKNFSDWMKTTLDKQYEEIKYLFPKIEGDYKEYVLEKNSYQEYVIRYPPIEKKDMPVVCFVRNKITGKEYISAAVRVPLKIWEDVENYIQNVEYSWDELEREDIDMQEEGLSVRVGPLISHKKEGVQVEILKDGKSLLPSPKRVWFNMRGIEQFQDIIMERRNEEKEGKKCKPN